MAIMHFSEVDLNLIYEGVQQDPAPAAITSMISAWAYVSCIFQLLPKPVRCMGQILSAQNGKPFKAQATATREQCGPAAETAIRPARDNGRRKHVAGTILKAAEGP